MDQPNDRHSLSRTTVIMLVLLALAHFGLAAWHATIAPWRTEGIVRINRSPEKDIGAPDERQHVNYAARLANGKGFPVFDPKDPNLYENYQSHQPPAFYLLAAAWSKLTAADVAEGISTSGTGLRMRLLNGFVGAAGVVGTFFLVWWGFRREDVAIAAAAFAALLPMNVALSGAVSNDPLLIALSAWVLALAASGVVGGWTWAKVLTIAVLTGVALMTKTTAVALLPALLVAAVVPQVKKPSVAMAGVLVALSLAIAAPWWVRNQTLYGDPLAMKAFTDAFQGSAQKSAIVDGIAQGGDSSAELTYWKDWVGWWTARSFFGVFGYMDIWLNETGSAISSRDRNTLYRLLLVGFVVAFLGWVLASSKPEWKPKWNVQLINGVFILVVLLLFIRFNLQYFQAQGRYVLPALAPIACGFGIGLTYLCKNRGMVAAGITATLLFCLNIYALNRLPGEFEKRTRDAASSSTRLPYTPVADRDRPLGTGSNRLG